MTIAKPDTRNPIPGRVLALDYGTKRIGIAISDELRMLASPRGIIPNGPDMIKQIVQLVQKENVRVVVLGVPRTLSNTESQMTTQVLKFKAKLSLALEAIGVPLETRDERLTSIMANYNISQRGLPKGKREEKSLRDEEAARIVLQEYLDSR